MYTAHEPSCATNRTTRRTILQILHVVDGRSASCTVYLQYFGAQLAHHIGLQCKEVHNIGENGRCLSSRQYYEVRRASGISTDCIAAREQHVQNGVPNRLRIYVDVS